MSITAVDFVFILIAVIVLYMPTANLIQSFCDQYTNTDVSEHFCLWCFALFFTILFFVVLIPSCTIQDV